MMPELNRIYNGDCLDVMRSWPDNFVDSIITDPPYGLSFMGKDWDFGVPGTPFWIEALRIAKPGTMLLAFGGTRTYHRLAVAIEDAGWQIRDCIMWLYGSGFPKSLNISKAIDNAKGAEREVIGTTKTNLTPYGNIGGDNVSGEIEVTAPATDLAQLWDGWGTALKPAWEPILVAMKPLDGNFAQNAERWGVAGLDVDGCRIGSELLPSSTRGESVATAFASGGMTPERIGRWPANVVLDEDAATLLDQQSGVVGGGDAFSPPAFKANGGSGASFSIAGQKQAPCTYGDYGGASRFFYVAKTAASERNEGLEDEPPVSCGVGALGDGGRGKWAQNHHPTVKPLELMKYLCALTKTPRGGIVLDPFCGSGTTLWAAESHNRPWLGIEKDPEYVRIAQARIAKEQAQLKLPLEAIA